MKKLICIAFVLIAFVLAGCQTFYKQADSSRLVILNHEAGTRLIDAAGANLNKDDPIIVASFVNIDNLNASSSLGRVSSQQVATQFTNAGFHIIEIRLRKDVCIRQEKGEFLLSRQLQQVGARHCAQAVLVGTYAVGENNVYLTTKVIDAVNSRTISSYDYQIAKDHDIKILLQNKGESGSGPYY